MGMAAIDEHPATRRFTSDEVWKMVEIGLLGPDEPYELIAGKLLYVSPQNPPHANAIGRLTMALVAAYGSHGYLVRVQCPLGGIVDSITEPDIAVVPFAAAEGRHPRADEALLLVEVADTTLRGEILKRPVYAAAGAPEYWIVDINREVVTVHTGSAPDGAWRRSKKVRVGEDLALPGIPDHLPASAIVGPRPR